MSRVPDDLSIGWFMKNMNLSRNLMRYLDQHKAAAIVSPDGKIVPGRYSHTSKNVIYDLREVETSAEPLVIAAPFLAVAEDDPNQELDVSWTLPDSYDQLFLERSEDGITGWVLLATLAGTETAYDDAAVTVGVEEFYRIRGSQGGAYSAYSNIDSGVLTAAAVAQGVAWNWELITTSPAAVNADSDYVMLSSGYEQTLGIKSDGTLWAVGKQIHGQLGLNDTTTRWDFEQVGSDTDWAYVACGNECSFAIKTNGTLWACGWNFNGQLGLNDTTDRHVFTQVGVGTNWAAVSTGSAHSLAVKTDGTLWSTGWNLEGQLGQGDFGAGTDRDEFTQVGADTDWAFPACGGEFSMATKTTGTLWATGRNTEGQLGQGDTTNLDVFTQVGSDTDWSLPAAGERFGACIKTGGTLWTCGRNWKGQLGQGDTTQRTSFTQVGAATDWEQPSCGEDHMGGLKTDGTIWAWGKNDDFQLGQGDTTQRTSPTQIGADTDWLLLALGRKTQCAIKTA